MWDAPKIRVVHVADMFTHGGAVTLSFDEDAADTVLLDVGKARRDNGPIHLDYTKLGRLIEWLSAVRRDMKVQDTEFI